MFGHDFYFRLIRKYIVLFGTLFNDIHISRDDGNGNSTHYIKVPIQYGPKEKIMSRVDADPDIGRQTALLVPRMSFEMIGMRYDEKRKLTSTVKNVVKNSANTSLTKTQYTPVPYTMTFELTIFVKNAEDGTKILEQILPFFRPDFTPSVELIAEMDDYRDIPIVLDTIESSDTYTNTYETRRAITHVLTFSMLGYLYGPIKNTGVIKFANTNFIIANTVNIRDSYGTVDPAERITIRPGLDANGDPTSDISLSVPLSQIESDDRYGYIITIENL